jgi:O-antigen/teichoic acid export membrane protein
VSVARAASAGLWSAVDVVARQGVQFVTAMILARLLAPSDFGTVALTSFFSSLAQVLLQGGITTALIQKQDTTHAEENATFWLNILVSTLLATTLVAIGPLVARFYGIAVLAPLMWAAAAQVMLTAVGAVHAALLARSLSFATLAKVGVGSSLLSGIVGLAAAFAGLGVWALAWQGVVAAGTYGFGLWLVSAWRPGRMGRLSESRRLLGFGAWLSVASVLDLVYTQGVSLLLGKLHGVRELGLYNRASSTQLLPSTILSLIIARVALPLFVPKIGDRDATRRGLRLAIGIVMMLNVPIMLGLCLIPDLIVAVLFGRQWLGAAPILSVLALGGIFYPMHVINLHVLLASGATRTFLRVELIKKAIAIVLVMVGSFYGVLGLAWSQVAVGLVSLVININATKAIVDYGVYDQLKELRGIWFCGLCMSVATLSARTILTLPPTAELAAVVALSATTFAACGFVFRVALFRDAIRILSAAIRERKASI